MLPAHLCPAPASPCALQGTLAALDTKNPVMYLDFPQGRYKLFGAGVGGGAVGGGDGACHRPAHPLKRRCVPRLPPAASLRTALLPALPSPRLHAARAPQARWCSPKTSMWCCAWGSARCCVRTCWRAWCATSARALLRPLRRAAGPRAWPMGGVVRGAGLPGSPCSMSRSPAAVVPETRLGSSACQLHSS